MRHLLRVLFWAFVFIGLAGVTFVSPVSAAERGNTTLLQKFFNPYGEKYLENNPGGVVDEFKRDVKFARQMRTKVIFAGECLSSCTLYLSLPRDQLCLMPGVIFGFHKPFIRKDLVASFSPERAEAIISGGSTEMYNMYPPWVQAWLRKKGGLSVKFKYMPYEYAKRYIKTCT